LERHQTLRQAVAWSYELLDEDEKGALQRCSVFAGGFDLVAATHLCGGDTADEYGVLDLLASLARKSLITVGRVDGHARYGMLETIRQFAQEQLAATDRIEASRDRHAAYYAQEAVTHWDSWEGPGYRAAVDWVDTDFANLRTAFRWAIDRGDVVTATAIAAHISQLAFFLLLFEPLGWAEEILPSAIAADVRHLPRLYTAASLCAWIGRPDLAVDYAETAVALHDDPRYDPFDPAFSRTTANTARLSAGGDLDYAIEVYADLARQPGVTGVWNRPNLMVFLPVVGRAEEARALADEALRVALAHRNPVYIAWVLIATGRVFADSDPARALDAFRQALTVTQEERIPFLEARVAWEAANLETIQGDLDHGLELFDTAIDACHRGGNIADLSMVLSELAVFFDRAGKHDTAAIVQGSSNRYPTDIYVIGLSAAVDHLRGVLGETVFEGCVATGAAMEIGDAVAYARHEIEEARRQIRDAP
jgi:tetratricopeptide (TPR) repeat protein